MKSMLPRAALAICLAVIAFSAGASVGTARAKAPSRYMTYAYVKSVVVHEDQYLYVAVYGNYVTTFDGCRNNAFGRSQYTIDDDRTKAMMTAAYASMLGKIPIVVWTNGCVDADTSGYRVIEALQPSLEGKVDQSG